MQHGTHIVTDTVKTKLHLPAVILTSGNGNIGSADAAIEADLLVVLETNTQSATT